MKESYERKSVSEFDRKSLVFIVIFVFIFGVFFSLGFFKLVQFPLKSEQFSQNSSTLKDYAGIDLRQFDELYNLIKERYIWSFPDDLTDGILKGLVNAFNDPYLNYLTKDEALVYQESKNPDFEGIGVVLKFNGENTEIETVLDGYPAQRAGLLAGDIIIKIDEESAVGLTSSIVAGKIRGEKGTEVSLQILRKTSMQPLEFSIVREKINVENVKVSEVDNSVYRIDINQFIDSTPTEFNNSWQRQIGQIKSPKGLIVDLRNNPGGYVSSVRYVLEEFFSKGTVLFKEEDLKGKITTFTSSRDGKFANIPIVLLVNEGSASASEIFASSVRDQKRGKIIGTNTVGKGVEQEVIEDLRGGGMLVIPFQKWLSPSGTLITKENPIKPDYYIEFDFESYQKRSVDNQFQKALEVLISSF